MKRCPYCSELIEDGLGFCPICCEELPEEEPNNEFRCPYCNEVIDKNSKVCPICCENISPEEPEAEENKVIDEAPTFLSEPKQEYKCPYCAEVIDENSAVCPICGESLKDFYTKNLETVSESDYNITPKNENCESDIKIYKNNNNKKSKKTIIAVVSVLGLIILICGICLHNYLKNNLSLVEEAMYYRYQKCLQITDTMTNFNKEDLEKECLNRYQRSIDFINMFIGSKLTAQDEIKKYEKNKYKVEIESYLAQQISIARKDIDDNYKRVKEAYEKVKKGYKPTEDEYMNLQTIDMWFDSPIFNIYSEMINITEKYTKFDKEIPATDYTGALADFITPYLKGANVDLSKLTELENYESKKFEEAEKYVDLHNQILGENYFETNFYPKEIQNNSNETYTAPKYNGSQNGSSVKNTTSNITQINWSPYMNKLLSDIHNRWIYTEDDKNRQMVARFTVNKSGCISNIDIFDPTNKNSIKYTKGYNLYTSINNASCIYPLPQAYNRNTIGVEIFPPNFQYKLYADYIDMSNYPSKNTSPVASKPSASLASGGPITKSNSSGTSKASPSFSPTASGRSINGNGSYTGSGNQNTQKEKPKTELEKSADDFFE